LPPIAQSVSALCSNTSCIAESSKPTCITPTLSHSHGSTMPVSFNCNHNARQHHYQNAGTAIGSTVQQPHQATLAEGAGAKEPQGSTIEMVTPGLWGGIGSACIYAFPVSSLVTAPPFAPISA
jgi:hypothetical protein